MICPWVSRGKHFSSKNRCHVFCEYIFLFFWVKIHLVTFPLISFTLCLVSKELFLYCLRQELNFLWVILKAMLRQGKLKKMHLQLLISGSKMDYELLSELDMCFYTIHGTQKAIEWHKMQFYRYSQGVQKIILSKTNVIWPLTIGLFLGWL